MEAQRLRNANLLAVNDVKSVERAPLNVIKYVKIVVEDKIASFETQNNIGEINSDESVNNEQDKRQDEGPEKNVNNSRSFSINSYPNKQKSNYRCEENVKIPVKSCSNDKCLPDETYDEIDTVADHERDFCINIYNLLSAKESLV